MESVMQFVSQVRQELGKVVWPTLQDFVGSTIIVLILVTAFAIYLGIIDAGLAWVAREKIF
ncbi:preprotein translocase subunit SecE [Candidatus Dependentiae bacterium]|nr:preprotein translocase subunit SecE [Candidatus Dependentiae bacterium]